jgi:uncharacterized protein YdaU (DUF1376 family)
MSRKLPWFKFFPRDFLDGVRGMTLEERGAYFTLLALMYDREGAIPEDERWLCGNLDCDPRVWRRLRDRLSRLGKIIPDVNGTISNARAIEEITSALSTAQLRRKSAVAGGYQSGKMRRLSLKDNDKNEASGEANAEQSTEREYRTPLSPPKGAERGHRLSEDWAPDDALRSYAADLGLTPSETEAAASDFSAYWRGRTDRTARKTAGGWRQAFQNRLRAIVTSVKLRAELRLVHVAPAAARTPEQEAEFRRRWIAAGKPPRPEWGDPDLFQAQGAAS